ncbi:hypothetical protein CDL12_27548 [Handroanthus impetiginosus]|uniref:Uncharacterized protein n=1 Tax=Handroanthus impetiginosus TaxID=429701 RepID=A0A2G9G3S8_9LAMI|nr:hypothetical protein CDL12_27548 [Handroanthus impetiginosus]
MQRSFPQKITKSDALVDGEEHDKEGDPFDKEACSPPGESKRKSHSYPLEESGGSNADRHWKRQRKDFKPSKLRNDSVINPSSTEEFLKKLWSDLRQRIANTPIDSISSIYDDVQFVLESMTSFNKFDIAQLEELLKVLFDKASAYDEVRSTSSNKASEELFAQQLGEVKDHFHNAQAQKVKAANQIQYTEEKLESIEKELVNLKEHKKNLYVSLNSQAEVLEIKEEITAIENALPSSDEAMENLKIIATHLEVAKGELKSLVPFA